jgi:hypothetical protein
MSEHRVRKEQPFRFPESFLEISKNSRWKILFAGRNQTQKQIPHIYDKNHNKNFFKVFMKHRKEAEQNNFHICFVPLLFVFISSVLRTDCDFF